MINYVKGDASVPMHKPCAILHVVNDIGAFGGGFTSFLAQRYPTVEQEYRQAHRNSRLKLGDIICHHIDENLVVISMCAQRGIISSTNTKPLKPEYLEQCLHKADDASQMWVHWQMPRIGCGLAGGVWTVDVLPFLQALKERTITVCDFEPTYA